MCRHDIIMTWKRVTHVSHNGYQNITSFISHIKTHIMSKSCQWNTAIEFWILIYMCIGLSALYNNRNSPIKISQMLLTDLVVFKTKVRYFPGKPAHSWSSLFESILNSQWRIFFGYLHLTTRWEIRCHSDLNTTDFPRHVPAMTTIWVEFRSRCFEILIIFWSRF